MKFENISVYNFKNALRGMRNPKNSWHLSDSFFGMIQTKDLDKYIENLDQYTLDNCILEQENEISNVAIVGPKDMKLAQTLIAAGPEHRKFMRQIFVSVDITAPLFFWKEFDTYKVGTVANSTSTMHKITSAPITMENFELDDFSPSLIIDSDEFRGDVTMSAFTQEFIDYLESLRQKYLETGNKEYWKELIRWLPESWLQTRTVTMNYENLLAICSKGQRRFHKLSEWSTGENSFINFARGLPYAQKLIFIDEDMEQNTK